MALGRVIPAERTVKYVDALADLTEKQLTFGFAQALKLFKPEFGVDFPPPALIREWAEQYRPVDPIVETRKYLTRDDKPPTWEELGRKSGATPEDIARWLDEGKAVQRAKIATLEADPEWRAMAERLGARPKLVNFAEAAMAERNGVSRVPKDPAERASWARDKAIEHGWIPENREPGDDDE